MRFFHYQIKYRAGNNHLFWEDHVQSHDNANDERVRDRLVQKHIENSWQEVEPEDSHGFIQINGGEISARVVKCCEVTEEEYNVLVRFIG